MASAPRSGVATSLNAVVEGGASVRVWLSVMVLIVALGAASLWLVRSLERGPMPPHLSKDAVATSPVPRDDGVLRLAGAGPNLPLTRALVDAYVRANPNARIHVHESIGSRGGVEALVDGRIDIALLSRQLTDNERALALLVLPYAIDAVVFAAHPSVPVDGLTSSEAVDLFSGRRATWGDGSRVVILQRERDEPKHAVAGEMIPGFQVVDDAARRNNLWHVMFSDEAIQQTLINAPGSMALLNLGAAVSQQLPIKVLSLDGVRPDEASVISGAYPLHVELSFAVRTRATRGQIADFLRFVYSPDGIAVIQQSGYIPMASEGL